MFAKTSFTNTLKKLGCYDIRLCSHTDPRGRRYYSGFIVNPKNNVVVYLNSESFYNNHCENKFLVRFARKVGDYTGGINNFCEPKNSPYFVHKLLTSPKMYAREFSK